MKAEVFVIGGGPVGLTTALLLAHQGVRVTVVERNRHPVAQLRAIALDDECLRIWQACGLESMIDEDWDGGSPDHVICRYLSAQGRTFLKLTQYESDLGYPHAVAIHEPRITGKLRLAVDEHPMIEYLGDCRVDGIHQDEHCVNLQMVDSSNRTVERRGVWVVACDGASSTIRSLLGIDMRGVTLPNPWLVANLVDKETLDHIRIHCDSARPSVTMSMPHGVRRIECMLAVDDPGTWLEQEERVREKLGTAWSGAATAPILDCSILQFNARIAERWRCGRVFLAGDAAHTTPPFAGQGLATGLRDASNIAFKIAGVCQGWLPEEVLASYESERRPHQERMIRLALRLGTLMMPRTRGQAVCSQLAVYALSRLDAARRHFQLRGHDIRPVYRQGFLRTGRSAGQCLPQPWIEVSSRERIRLDSLLGLRMTWLAVGSGHRPGSISGFKIAPDDTVLVENRDFRDPGRILQRSLGTRSVVLIRPDRMIHSHFKSKQTQISSRSNACHAHNILDHGTALSAGSSV